MQWKIKVIFALWFALFLKVQWLSYLAENIGEKLDGRPYTSNDSWKNSDYVTFSLFSLLWSWKSDSSITYFNSYTLFKCLAHEVSIFTVFENYQKGLILKHCERNEHHLFLSSRQKILLGHLVWFWHDMRLFWPIFKHCEDLSHNIRFARYNHEQLAETFWHQTQKPSRFFSTGKSA